MEKLKPKEVPTYFQVFCDVHGLVAQTTSVTNMELLTIGHVEANGCSLEDIQFVTNKHGALKQYDN
jgi:hypothetical protein